MSPKTIAYIGAFIGTTVGGMVPILWGGSLMSISSVLWGGIGGIIGIVIALKFVKFN